MAAAPPVDELFAAKLSKLTGSKESIEDLSQWVQFHRRRIKQIVPIWFKEVQKDDGKRLMLYFYLCNDVMQGSRKKGSECIEAFGKALPAATKLCSRCREALRGAALRGEGCRRKEPKTTSGLQRLLKIWLDREIFPVAFINDLLGSLDPEAAPSRPVKSLQSAYVPHTSAAKKLAALYVELASCEEAETALSKDPNQANAFLEAAHQTLLTRKRLLDGLQHEESHHAAVLETTNASIALCKSQLGSLEELHRDLQQSRHRKRMH